MKSKYTKTLKQIRKLTFLTDSCRTIYLDKENKCVYKIDSVYGDQNPKEIKRWKKYKDTISILNPCLAHHFSYKWVCQPLLNTNSKDLAKAWRKLLGKRYSRVLDLIESDGFRKVLTIEKLYSKVSSLPKKSRKTKKFLKDLITLTHAGVCDFSISPTTRQWGLDSKGNIRLCDYGL